MIQSDSFRQQHTSSDGIEIAYVDRANTTKSKTMLRNLPYRPKYQNSWPVAASIRSSRSIESVLTEKGTALGS
eukprot:3118342-Amphidinium_carterae.1